MNPDLKHPAFVDGYGWYVVTVHNDDSQALYLHNDGNLYTTTSETPSSKGWFLYQTQAEEARKKYYDTNNMIDGVVERVTSQPLFFRW